MNIYIYKVCTNLLTDHNLKKKIISFYKNKLYITSLPYIFRVKQGPIIRPDLSTLFMLLINSFKENSLLPIHSFDRVCACTVFILIFYIKC